MSEKHEADLFSRAREAAGKVTTLQGEIAVRRVELKKARTEATSLKRQVMDALKGVRKARGPRKKKEEAATPGTCEHGNLLAGYCEACADLVNTVKERAEVVE